MSKHLRVFGRQADSIGGRDVFTNVVFTNVVLTNVVFINGVLINVVLTNVVFINAKEDLAGTAFLHVT